MTDAYDIPDDVRQKLNAYFAAQLSDSINDLFGVTSTVCSEPGPALTIERLREAMSLLDRPDPRPYGKDTEYIINAHTWSVIMCEPGVNERDFNIRERIKIDGEWRPVKTGEVLMVHRSRMYELTGGEAYWGYSNAIDDANRKFTIGAIDCDEYMRLVDDTRADYETTTEANTP